MLSVLNYHNKTKLTSHIYLDKSFLEYNSRSRLPIGQGAQVYTAFHSSRVLDGMQSSPHEEDQRGVCKVKYYETQHFLVIFYFIVQVYLRLFSCKYTLTLSIPSAFIYSPIYVLSFPISPPFFLCIHYISIKYKAYK